MIHRRSCTLTTLDFGFLLALAAPARAEFFAYVTAQGADALSIVDLAQGRVVETVKIGRKPAGIAVAPGGQLIYATNPEGKSFSVVERGADGRHKVIAEIAGAGPLGIALDPKGARTFVADRYEDRVHVFDAARQREIAEVTVGQSPAGMATDPECGFLYVANRQSETFSVVDLATLKKIAVAVGKPAFWRDL